MADTLLDFSWDVAEDGYVWKHLDRAHGQRPLLTKRNAAKDAAVRRYHPLREFTGLFRTFAETPRTAEGALSFANRFGRLGLPDAGYGGQEALDEWVSEIAKLHDLIRIWGLIGAKDARGLRAYVSFAKGHAAVRTDNLGHLSIGNTQHGDVIQPAREFLRHHVNAGLYAGNVPQLEWRPDQSGLRLSYSPEALIGAIWLQFAQAISEPKEFRHCRMCGRPYEVSRDPLTGRRADSVFCSDACKSRDYRARKREAHRLGTKGKSVRDIARRLQSPTGTVRRWLQGDRRPGS